MENAEELLREDFRMRFRIYIDDIKYVKTRQWTVTYYLLLLIAAIIGLQPVLRDTLGTVCLRQTHPNLIIVSFVFVTIIGIIGTYFQLDFQCRLKKYRGYLRKQVIPKLSKTFAAMEIENMGEKYDSLRKGLSFTLIFLGILWAGVFTAYYFLLN